ncbi:MAG: hypothetical protein HQK99_05310 [Nitrospirae bacterium]|nr:hypothetical protein [Nitrospirota bacterium]
MICEKFKMEYHTKLHCIEYDVNEEIICAEENDKEFIIDNASLKKIMKIKIDKCVITKKDKQPRCDYLFIDCDDKILYFVELKGTDILWAIKQIEMTFDKFDRNTFCIRSTSINAYIVTSAKNIPNILSEEALYLKEILKRSNGRLEIVQTPYVLTPKAARRSTS